MVYSASVKQWAARQMQVQTLIQLAQARNTAMSMQQMSYEVSFLTPAFLGNAEQNGQWRTPPFKALLPAARRQVSCASDKR